MNTPKIMVVDDELGPREALKMILRDDYEVSTASCGAEALAHLDAEEFDLVILDIRMPDINGIDLLALVKSKVPETEVVMITAYASVETATNALRRGALDYLIKPFDSSAVKEVVKKGLVRRTRQAALLKKQSELQVVNASLRTKIDNARQNIQNHYLETVRSLVAAIDAKDSYTKGHQERVAFFTGILGEKIGLPEEEKKVLWQAAILHDIGKIGVPEQILRKTGRLTEQEFKIIKQHPVIGAEIISPVGFLQKERPIILYHHEKFDGTGYPEGLRGKQIPYGARIIAVADALDAMLSNRPYAPAKTPVQVREELRRCAGTQFDPQVAEIALEVNLPARNPRL
ncbi:MAG: HD domain-containing phosphohydrolase [Dethiobacteria bacterium]|jgi:putative two-component system response regulator